MARLLADENCSGPVIEELRRLGHDVVTVADEGLANQRTPDQDVLRRAREIGRSVLTYDRWDYVRLHRNSDAHEGIVICTPDADYQALAARIHAVISASPVMSGKLLRIDRAEG